MSVVWNIQGENQYDSGCGHESHEVHWLHDLYDRTPIACNKRLRLASKPDAKDELLSTAATDVVARPIRKVFFKGFKRFRKELSADPTKFRKTTIGVVQYPGAVVAPVAHKRLARGTVHTGQYVIDEAAIRELVDRLVQEKLETLDTQPGQAVGAARERGAAYARTEYANPVNVTLQRAAVLAGVSERVVNERRQNGQYYALLLDSKQRGFRFPSWQFDADPKRLHSVLKILDESGVNCWVQHQFLTAPHVQLDGLTPCVWIVDAKRELERLLSIARARFLCDQGAG